MAEPKWKVWVMVMRPDEQNVIHRLEEAGCEVVPGRDFKDARSFTEEEMLAKVPEMDALMVSTGELITRKVLESAGKCRVISKRGRGVEQIDVDAATELGIMVTNTPTDLNASSTAEYTVALILAMAKKLKLADYNARQGKWRSVQNTLLRNKTIGIIGLGRIGSRVAALLRPFEVRLLAYSPRLTEERARASGVERTDLETLLRESDFVTLHAVQTEESKGLIGEAQLGLMKPSAYLINAARGGLVVEGALANALKEKRIAGAALDVFEPEIPEAGNPLLDGDIYFETLYSPHAAGLNSDNVLLTSKVQMENCLAALRGEVPEFVVNRQVIPRWQARFGNNR